MKNIDRTGWQRLDDPPYDHDDFEAFLRARKEKQQRLNSPSSRGLPLGFNQVFDPVPDRALKPSYRTEGMSRFAAISMLYGPPSYPTKYETNNDKKQTCRPSRDSYSKGMNGVSAKINQKETQHVPLKRQIQGLDKKLPVPPAPLHRVGGLKWQREQEFTAGRMSQVPNDQTIPGHTYVPHRQQERAMFGIAGLNVNHLEDQDKEVARKPLKEEEGPQNPFDDYYVLGYIEERKLTRGNGTILPMPGLERLERERERDRQRRAKSS